MSPDSDAGLIVSSLEVWRGERRLFSDLSFELTPGQVHDSQAAALLLDDLQPDSFVLADKAYDAGWIRELIEAQDAATNIPDRSNAKKSHPFSPTLYRERNRVERFFNRLRLVIAFPTAC